MTNAVVTDAISEKPTGHPDKGKKTEFTSTAAYAANDDGDAVAGIDHDVVAKWDAALEQVGGGNSGEGHEPSFLITGHMLTGRTRVSSSHDSSSPTVTQ